MRSRRRFTSKILSAVRVGRIVGLRAGEGPHRVIGIWAVVAQGRVFVRSWGVKPGGWYRTFLETPRGSLYVEKRKLSVRAVQTRSQRLKAAVDRAYAEKYSTPGSIRYVRDLRRPKSRNTTTELLPL